MPSQDFKVINFELKMRIQAGRTMQFFYGGQFREGSDGTKFDRMDIA